MLIEKLKRKSPLFPELFSGDEVLRLRSQERFADADGTRRIPDIIIETETDPWRGGRAWVQ
jgi:hypothetical protein